MYFDQNCAQGTSHSLRSQLTPLSATIAANMPKKSVNGSHTHYKDLVSKKPNRLKGQYETMLPSQSAKLVCFLFFRICS